jgi:hypothetical protein
MSVPTAIDLGRRQRAGVSPATRASTLTAHAQTGGAARFIRSPLPRAIVADRFAVSAAEVGDSDELFKSAPVVQKSGGEYMQKPNPHMWIPNTGPEPYDEVCNLCGVFSGAHHKQPDPLAASSPCPEPWPEWRGLTEEEMDELEREAISHAVAP